MFTEDAFPAQMVLEYHDFVLVIAALDAEWTRVLPATSSGYKDSVYSRLVETQSALAETAAKFVSDLEEYQKYWVNGQTVCEDVWKQAVEARLYSVQTWLPFGHPDALAILAADEIEAAHSLMEAYSKGVEEVTTAFCPKMQSYRDRHHEETKLFQDVLEIFTEGRPEDLDSHPFQSSQPLLIISRLRLSPLLTLARALSSQKAVLDVVASRLVSAKQAMAKMTDDPLGVKDHLDSLRVSFLDLQDEEELGILVWGTHYSAMMALISAAQHLTVGDFIEAAPEAAIELFSSRCARALLEIEVDSAELETSTYLERPEIQKVKDNHLFRWSRSLSATSPALSGFIATPKHTVVPVGGWVQMATHVSVMLGHQCDVESVLDKLPNSNAASQEVGYRLHTLGSTDMLAQWSEHGSSKLAISTKKAAGLWHELITTISKETRTRHRRDFTGWNALITIPVPDQQPLHRSVGIDHEPLFHELMSGLQEGVPGCLTHKQIREITRIMGLSATNRRPLIFLAQNFGQVISNPLLFDVLVDHLDVIETLSNALENHLQGRANEAPHPLDYTSRAPQELVEQLNVLTAALDDAFELRLRRLYPDNPVRDWSLDMRSQNHQVLLGADAVLKCALAVFRKDVLRLENPDPKITDKRQSLGVVLHLKFHAGIEATSLGAFRTLASRESDEEKPAPRLAIFEADYPHLRSILGYSHFYHESAHLIFDELASQPAAARGEDNISLPEDLLERYYQPNQAPSAYLSYPETVQEMFVHMIMLLFIFDGDRDLMLRDHLHDLAVNLASAPNQEEFTAAFDVGKTEAEIEATLKQLRVLRFSESFFHALAPILWLEHVFELSPSSVCAGLDLCRRQKSITKPRYPSIESFTNKALERLIELKGAYPDYDWLFPSGDPTLKDHFLAHIGHLYSATYTTFENSWFTSRAIYSHHIQRIARESRADFSTPKLNQRNFEAVTEDILPDAEAARYQLLQIAVDEQIKNRWLNARDGYKPLPGNPAGLESGLLLKGHALDANLLIRRSLYHYLKKYRGKHSDARLGLPREITNSGKVNISALKEKPHALFMIDRTAVDLFCCVPHARRERVGQEIAFLKSIWDIAARNRARRLVSLKQKVVAQKNIKPLKDGDL